MNRKRFKIGNRIGWNSEAGRVSGTIVNVVTSPIEFKGYKVHASEDEPQYECTVGAQFKTAIRSARHPLDRRRVEPTIHASVNRVYRAPR